MSVFTKNVLVLGGGVAGLSAARALNERGVGVCLAEKKDHLGGKALDWACMATDTCQNCGACLVAELADQVSRQDHTEIRTRTELAGLSRRDEGFEAILAGESSKSVKVDAVLVATGFSTFDPARLKSLGYGSIDKVITTADLNELLKTGRIAEAIPEGGAPSIAFIQCVGSRNRKLDRNYCSQVCCKISLRHANKLLHLYPDAQITVYHMDLQIVGKEFRTFAEKLSKRVKLVQGVAAEMASDRAEGKVTLFHEDEAVGVRKAHHHDLVVLSVGMGACENAGELASKLGARTDSWGFLSLNDEDLPEKIYAAGAVRGPMNILSSIQQGRIAAERIACDFGVVPEFAGRRPTAVVGGGGDALAVSKTLAENGRPVVVVDPGENGDAADSRIETISGASLVSVEGAVGNYILNVENGDGVRKVAASAIVVASGASRTIPDPGALSGNIVALDEFRKYPEEKIPQKVVFALDRFGPENKENVREVLETATSLVEKGKSAYVLMRKMLVHGLKGQERYDAARKGGVKFLRADESVAPVLADDGKQVKIAYRDETLPGMEIVVSADLAVVAEKTAPAAETSVLAGILKQETDAEGFIQSPNSRHRPVGSPRKGIFFFGNCHEECDGDDFKSEAAAILAGLNWLDENGAPSGRVPRIFENECIKCLTCLRVCPHGAVMLQKTAKPVIVPEACFECGLCVSNCPAKAIRQEAFSDSDISGGNAVADTFVFACERSAHLAAKEAERMGIRLNDKLHVQPVACVGRVGVENMLAPLLNGAKRVILAGCHEGNCRSMESGTYAKIRVGRIAEDLKTAGDKLSYHAVAANEPDKFEKIVSDTEGKDERI